MEGSADAAISPRPGGRRRGSLLRRRRRHRRRFEKARFLARTIVRPAQTVPGTIFGFNADAQGHHLRLAASGSIRRSPQGPWIWGPGAMGPPLYQKQPTRPGSTFENGSTQTPDLNTPSAEQGWKYNSADGIGLRHSLRAENVSFQRVWSQSLRRARVLRVSMRPTSNWSSVTLGARCCPIVGRGSSSSWGTQARGKFGCDPQDESTSWSGVDGARGRRAGPGLGVPDCLACSRNPGPTALPRSLSTSPSWTFVQLIRARAAAGVGTGRGWRGRVAGEEGGGNLGGGVTAVKARRGSGPFVASRARGVPVLVVDEWAFSTHGETMIAARGTWSGRP